MTDELPKNLSKFQKAVQGIEAQIPRLIKPLACKAGCSHCCKDHNQFFHISDIEWELITTMYPTEVNDAAANWENRKGACPFLVADKCTVYEARPIPCRLHVSSDVKSCIEDGRGTVSGKYYEFHFNSSIKMHSLRGRLSPNDAWSKTVKSFDPLLSIRIRLAQHKGG